MKLMILDGNSIMNRAFYGIRPLTTREGIATNAVFGFLSIFEKMRTEEQPDAVCVAFDLKGPTFRHLRYDGYKATRHPMPEELAMQMPLIKEVLTAMRIPIYACEGWEADDVLGTVGKQCCARGWNCVIVTGDRDSLQLIDGCVHIKLIISRPGQTTATLYTEEMFRDEYGFMPERMVDLKALMGDSSDNIPGVAGVGPKTATDLLSRFGTLDGVYDHLEDIKESVRKKLVACRENAYLSYELATIRCDAPVSFAPDSCLRKEPDKEALLEIFQKLEFRKLIEKYRLLEDDGNAAPPEEVPLLPSLDTLPEPVGVCALLIAEDGEKMAVATAAGVCEADCDQQYLKRLMLGAAPLICQDSKHLYRLLDKQKLPRPTAVFDTALSGYVLNPTESDYTSQRLAASYLGGMVPGSLAERCSALYALYPVLAEAMAASGLQPVYEKIDLPLCGVLADMEEAGILVDRSQLEEFGAMLGQRIATCQTAIFAFAGEDFNINSPKQLGDILFGKMGLKGGKKTKTGYSTNAEVLEKLRGENPIVEEILNFRQLSKLKSTYADGLLKVIGEDGRIHTTFQNMVTATGRLSSTEPNLQNIPVRTELGSEIRKMFVPKPGCVLVDADYSQIELRVLAHIADDSVMQEAFLSGADFHSVTASQVFGVPLEQVSHQMRRSAKAVNFGIVYGISKWSLSEDLGVSTWEAEDYINSYLRRFSGVRAYMHEIVESAKRTGYVTTLYGRRRSLPELKSSNFNIRAMGERMALNTPIQGSAADIIKLAMLRVSEALKAAKLEARLVLQVHDELIVECPAGEAETVKALVRQEMEQAATLCVPLTAEAAQGGSWYEAKT